MKGRMCLVRGATFEAVVELIKQFCLTVLMTQVSKENVSLFYCYLLILMPLIQALPPPPSSCQALEAALQIVSDFHI